MNKRKITIAKGDGIGPEIMDATMRILEAAGANIEPVEIEIGEKVYLQGHTSGIKPEAWEILNQTKVLLKAPITTPLGSGYKSLNVTLRKTLGLFANVRPSLSYFPYVHTHFPKLDIVIIRENEEDLYAGVEHRQTLDVFQCLKLISKPGTEKIIRYAFEYARANGRKKVTCMAKDNIMKLSDGYFHQAFDEIGNEYPDIIKDYKIIDIGAALLADGPEQFDVVVTMNLYGDIISDIVAQVSGSVGMAGSSNVGATVSMFEAIHGSAPDIAGKNIANPSGLINGALMMLLHIGEAEVASKIYNAWLCTIEEGIHTADIYDGKYSQQRVGTKEFANAVIERLGKKPSRFPAKLFHADKAIIIPQFKRIIEKQELVGVDIFINNAEKTAIQLGKGLENIKYDNLEFKLITNRGLKVYPDGHADSFCTDHWRCRFVGMKMVDGKKEFYHQIDYNQVIELMKRITEENFQIIKSENLYNFNGKKGFSLAQGE
jgi:isocitrate dehydrogenase